MREALEDAIAVLLIEDDAGDERLIREELEAGGLRASVCRVETAEQMDALLAERAWDLVLSDYNLPAFGPTAALQLLRARGLDIPFLVVSGCVGEETAVALLKAGAHDFVPKHRLARLVPAVERELREAALRAAHRQAHRELRESRQQLRELSNFLQTVREEERARIARELHDELGQALTALKIDLAWLRDQLPEAPDALTHKADRMLDIIDSTVDAVRRLAANLRPGLLDDLGLAASMEWLAEEFVERNGVPCELTLAQEEFSLEQPLAVALFRILQEALTNVARHAGARRVQVLLAQRDGEVVLEVADDGRGFDAGAGIRKRSYGLLGIRERVTALGGLLAIDSRPGGGTRLRVAIPLVSATVQP